MGEPHVNVTESFQPVPPARIIHLILHMFSVRILFSKHLRRGWNEQEGARTVPCFVDHKILSSCFFLSEPSPRPLKAVGLVIQSFVFSFGLRFPGTMRIVILR